MSQPKLPLPFKLSRGKILVPCVIFFLFLISITWYSAIKSRQTLDLVIAQNFSGASKSAQQAKIGPKILSLVTLGQSSTINSWLLALDSVDEVENLAVNLNFVGRNLLDPMTENANLKSLQGDLRALLDQTTQLETYLDQSLVLKNSPWHKKIQKLNDYGTNLLDFGQYLSEGSKQILIIFQNTEEIRATGGFMGSYAKVVFEEGKITDLKIQDIYEPDGQFQGFVNAPPGANEYLSGGNGLRLPDANWNPDFPKSAQIIATYFYYGHERDVDGLILLNVDLVERILKLVGEIYLPDYGLTATADNLTDLAHADRNSFFAGSKQKVNFLESLFTNLKLKVAQLSNEQIKNIMQIIGQGTKKKDLQFFSFDENIQKILEKNSLAGAMSRPSEANFFFGQVESNVGINKANKKITRSTHLEIASQRTIAKTTFKNDGSDSNEDYINYHRFYFDHTSKVQEIALNGQVIGTFDEKVVETSEGELLLEIGVLMSLESNQSSELAIAVTHPSICLETECAVALWKQSGIPATPHQVKFGQSQINTILETDEVIHLDQL